MHSDRLLSSPVLITLARSGLVFVLLLSGCITLPPRPGAPGGELPAVYTQAAQTVLAQWTGAAAETAAVSTGAPLTPPPRRTSGSGGLSGSGTRRPPGKNTPSPTPLPQQPGVTPRPGQATRRPSATAVAQPSPTGAAPASPSPTPPGSACNRMQLLGDVTAPPDTSYIAGAAFIKTWRVRNTGECAWTRDYALVMTGGNLTGATGTLFLPAGVPAGESTDLSVALNAPAFSGSYQSTWMLRSPDGELFGYGPNGGVALLARINALQPTYQHNYPFDMAFYACSGSWSSAAGLLACPGQPQAAEGFVTLLNNPQLETHVSREYGLWTQPNRERSGWISGELPAYTVTAGDRFQAELACLDGYTGCDVTFELAYRTSDGSQGTLGRWPETYDEGSTTVDLDLSVLARRSVTFILNVYNRGNPRQAAAVWLLPRVQKQSAPGGYTLAWQREDFPRLGDCDALRIALSGPNTGTAIAYDCSLGTQEIARAPLTGDQAEQLWYWVQRLGWVEGEVYTSSANHPVTAWVELRGAGVSQGSNSDIQAIQIFAAQVFQWIVQ
ncbi:MAG: NBR1-Ig-like domain-containing protein [Chloroflexota bacterium]